MKHAILFGFAAALLTAMVVATDSANAGGKKSDSVVNVKATLEKSAAGKSVVVIALDIKPGWHLYANPVGNADLENGQVVVKAAGANVTYPPGKIIDDKILGKYSVYEKRVEIRAALDRVVDAANPAEFTIKLQSCDDKNCLQPATVKVSVP